MSKTQFTKLFILILFFTNKVFSQNIDVVKFEATPKYTRKIYNPHLLVKAITTANSNDKEKFDAIFNWVVQNIDYDYKTFYNSIGSHHMSAKKILKSKKALCLNYAYLMDTLCAIAGIRNKTIFGYAKDEYFDLNDSIYFDNHAWNAVNLNGYWYLYDITFASGEVYYEYTKFYKFINFLIQHWAIQSKLIKIEKNKIFKSALNCNVIHDSIKSDNDSAMKMMVIKHPFVLKILFSFKPRIKRSFEKETHGEYYLTKPELFAIQHVPNHPVWSLTATKTIKNYEADSSFYNLDSTTFVNQKREGRSCAECEQEFSYDALNLNHYLRKEVLAFNSKNRWIPSDYERNIAYLNFIEAKKVEDSLTKMTLIDTVKRYIKNTRLSLKQAGSNEQTNYVLQKEKNRKKVYLLLEENKLLREFFKFQSQKNLAETKQLKDLDNKIKLFSKFIYKKYYSIKRKENGSEIKVDKQKVENTILNLNSQLKQNEEKIEILNRGIAQKKFLFDKTSPELIIQIRNKLGTIDTLFGYINESYMLRSYFSDNYKKDVRKVRAKINAIKFRMKHFNDSVFSTSVQLNLKSAEEILSQLSSRNKLLDEDLKIRKQLIAFGEMKALPFDSAKAEFLRQIQEDYCWLASNKIQIILKSYKFLYKAQQTIFKQINLENRIETIRESTVMAKQTRRRRNHMRILEQRRNSLFYFSKHVQKYKRSYLKKLNKEKKKQKK